MMQAMPPPAAYHCVKPDAPEATGAKMVVTVSGEVATMAAFLTEAKKWSNFKLEADAQSNGIRFVRMTASGSTPYRDIGGLIYTAQVRQLTVTMNSEPPICGMEEN
ncbi:MULTISPECIES: hypothetical protein [Sphingomonas]|uniref:hypothetical protein n=1 Tax=Sphingomonas TaxID=13687 RepID=UPI0012E120AB|nr:hypothetical protein [Sphingomonas sp. Leaf230]